MCNDYGNAHCSFGMYDDYANAQCSVGFQELGNTMPTRKAASESMMIMLTMKAAFYRKYMGQYSIAALEADPWDRSVRSIRAYIYIYTYASGHIVLIYF